MWYRAANINDLPLGRNIDELVRLVEALQFHEAHGEVCPAGWKKGDKGMNASPEGVAKYLAEEGRQAVSSAAFSSSIKKPPQ